MLIKIKPAPLVIPYTVTIKQGRLALLEAGYLDVVETAIASGNRADKITWEFSSEINRADPLVANMAIALGLSETDLDNLFLLASTK
jgi:hypothetical protein